MFRVITLNVNGIRSAAKKGFFSWMAEQNADVICLQEIKACDEDLRSSIFNPIGYYPYFHFAQKKGYSGVALYCKKKPYSVKTGLGWPEADSEGRYVEVDLGGLKVASLYLPSGTSGEERQSVKMDFLGRFAEYLKTQRLQPCEYILCGDWNIAHQKIDLKNWRGNQKHSGFLPEERAWMDHLFGEQGFVDAFRLVNPHPEQYTWWSNRGQAWLKNVGWRIDYQVITQGLKPAVKEATIYKERRFSDHAPLLIDYQLIYNVQK